MYIHKFNYGCLLARSRSKTPGVWAPGRPGSLYKEFPFIRDFPLHKGLPLTSGTSPYIRDFPL